MIGAAESHASPRGVRGRPWLVLATGLALAVVAAAWPLGQYWSDSQILVINAASWKPYYNAFYLPLGHLLWRVLSPFGANLEQALTMLSALAFGAVGACVALGAGRASRSTWLGVAAACLVASTPAAWFHGTVIEVHMVGALGAGAGWWLALRAHRAPRVRANRLLALAVFVTVGSHLSQVLWLPGIVYLALGQRRKALAGEPHAIGAGLGTRGSMVAAAAIVAVVVVGVLMVQAGTAAWALRADVVWLGTLFEFGHLWIEGLSTRGFYAPGEALRYIAAEWLWPQCLLLSAIPLTLLAWRRMEAIHRRLALGGLVGLVLPLLVLSQGGIYERGGYFAAALMPLGWLAAASSAAILRQWAVPLLLCLAAGQALIAERARAEFCAHWEDPRAWAAAVTPALAPGDIVLVASLAQHFALRTAAPDVRVWDLTRQLDMLPERDHTPTVRAAIATRLGEGVGRVFVDRTLLDPGAVGANRTHVLAAQLSDVRLVRPTPELPGTGGRLLHVELHRP